MGLFVVGSTAPVLPIGLRGKPLQGFSFKPIMNSPAKAPATAALDSDETLSAATSGSLSAASEGRAARMSRRVTLNIGGRMFQTTYVRLASLEHAC